MEPRGKDLSRDLTELEFEVRLHDRQRLDRYLQQCLGWKSRTKVQKLIELERVRVNGQVARSAHRLSDGDQIHVAMVQTGIQHDPSEEHPLEPPFWQDPYLLALNKPAHRLVHPTGRTLGGTVMNELHELYRGCNERGRRPVVPKLCHRLDRETSGVLLVAKTDPARRSLQAAFEEDRVRKEYLAIVEGEAPATFEIDVPIAVNLDRQVGRGNRLAVGAPDGKAAFTRFRRLACGAGYSVVACHPKTGRQNQIRVHLAHAGHPILGDVGYGSDPANWKPRDPGALPFPDRALLHNARLVVPHPIWLTKLDLRAEAPADMQLFVASAAAEIDGAG